MSKDFYEQTIKKIEDLVDNKEYNEAYKIVTKEINMPYIPLIYEDKFNELNLMLKQIIFKPESKILQTDEVIDYLFGNESQQVNAIQFLPSLNLREIKNDLKKRIETWDDPIKQATVYETMVDQEINIDILVGVKTVNPINFSMLKNDETIKAYEQLEKLNFKTPHKYPICIEQLQTYLLMSFPNISFKGEEISLQIFNIVNSMFDDNTELSDVEKQIKKKLNQKNKKV